MLISSGDSKQFNLLKPKEEIPVSTSSSLKSPSTSHPVATSSSSKSSSTSAVKTNLLKSSVKTEKPPDNGGNDFENTLNEFENFLSDLEADVKKSDKIPEKKKKRSRSKSPSKYKRSRRMSNYVYMV